MAVTPITPPRFTVTSVVTALSETKDWGLTLLGVPEIWSTTEGEGIKVAVLDTGIDNSHVDLKDGIAKTKDFTGSASGSLDVNGHGTHCAGIIGARSNGTGVIGVAPSCSLYVGKVLGDDGFGSPDYLVKGIEWAVKQGVDIISMSLGTYYPTPKMAEAVKAAYDAGVIIAAAAGNESKSVLSYPARYDEAISVGSINRDLLHSSFSNFSPNLDIVAPGEDVYSTFKGGLYAKLSGTSMATPFVAGVCALILAKHRKHSANSTPIGSPSDMRDHLRGTASDLGPVGFDPQYGWGLIHPDSAVSSAQLEEPGDGIETNLSAASRGCVERTYDRERERGADHHTSLDRARDVCGSSVAMHTSVPNPDALRVYIMGADGCTERVYGRERDRGADHHTALDRARDVCGTCVEIIRDITA